jgi:hypothetical protein
VELRLSRAGDSLRAALDAAAVPLLAGQVVWAGGDAVLARCFWPHARPLTGTSTRSALLVSEVLGEIGREVAEAVLNELLVGLEMYFDAEPEGALLDAARPRFAWGPPA